MQCQLGRHPRLGLHQRRRRPLLLAHEHGLLLLAIVGRLLLLVGRKGLAVGARVQLEARLSLSLGVGRCLCRGW